MTDPVYKIVELVGTSEKSISDAIDNAIKRAAQSIRDLGWSEIGQVRGPIAAGKVGRYQVTMKAGFTLEGTTDAG